MMRSITWVRRFLLKLAGPLFWLLVWFFASALIGRDYILASPVSVLARLFALLFTGEFWLSILNSFARIMGGFMVAVTLGTDCAALAARFEEAKALVSPVMALIHATPVVSLILLVVFWTKTENVPLVIAALMVLPVVYLNVSRGVKSVDRSLLEMADSFRVPAVRKLMGVYVPSVTPFFLSACSIGLGFAWKSGVAAEVIALSNQNIGLHLVEAKNLLENADLLAWTAVVVLLNVTMEKLMERAVRRYERRLEG